MATPVRLHAPVVLPCDPDCTVLRDAVVDIDEAGRVVHCGPLAGAPERPAGATVHRCSGILMPGLVNTHAHTPMTVLRGLGGDLPLLRWLNEAIWPAEARMVADDAYAGMRLGCVEMLRAGVTTSAESYFFPERIADAALEVGFRSVIGRAILDLPGMDSGGWRQQVGEISEWIDRVGLRFGPGELVEISYAPHSAYTVSPEALRAVAGAARERGALVQIHVAESLDEDRSQRERYGSVPRLLDEVGLLGCRLVGAHCVHMSDSDIELFARTGAGVSHCPGSNGKLASGMARLTDMVRAGVRVGLGTDGPASNDDLNLWQDARFAALLARVNNHDAVAISAGQALLLATRGGAAALQRDDIGALEPGRWADVVHLGADDTAFVAGLDVPDAELLANLFWAAGARAVRDVWVAGEQVLAEGVPSRVDVDEVRGKARAASLRLRG
ncbi:ethylammeline chlorohydrolase [Longimycelium tulufanense]|uniref:Ethylammeline chlorohydrolase n=1 Tax=Longimycelium tulufanense TaxID=907463 RepID=A0A8J3CIL8_9PSEU|nr:amidohydrolase [Longimycelium tulufanense]GGM67267.1 ethylammeline chlorohydrolase [Longimycelium tulufanense]